MGIGFLQRDYILAPIMVRMWDRGPLGLSDTLTVASMVVINSEMLLMCSVLGMSAGA